MTEIELSVIELSFKYFMIFRFLTVIEEKLLDEFLCVIYLQEIENLAIKVSNLMDFFYYTILSNKIFLFI